MESKHTPGPWKVCGVLVSNKDATIANCSLEHLKAAARIEYYSGEKQTDNDKANYLSNRLEIEDNEAANAHLIAACPDLFDCLVDCVENILIDFPDEDPRKIRYKEVLAKATGQPITCENQ